MSDTGDRPPTASTANGVRLPGPSPGKRRRGFLKAAIAVGAGGFAVAKTTATAQADTPPLVFEQSAENVNTPLFSVIPASAGAPPFQMQMNSFPNLGAGEGTYNRGVWFGFNAGRFAAGPSTSGVQGVYMGFEDNYFDAPGDATFGVEWYVGYTTPDGTTIGPADLRPFYFRVKDSDTNSPEKSVISAVDIGSGDTGSFTVMGSVTSGRQLFAITQKGIYARLRTHFTAPGGTIQIAPTTGYAQIDLIAPGTGAGGTYGVIGWRQGVTPLWSLAASASGWSVQDLANGDRRHFTLTPGPSDETASATLYCNVAVKGAFAANGVAPAPRAPAISAPVAPAPGYDRAAAQSITDAVNRIRRVLRDVGLTN